jgi:hypothetical protein
MALNPNWKPSYPGEQPPRDYYYIPGSPGDDGVRPPGHKAATPQPRATITKPNPGGLGANFAAGDKPRSSRMPKDPNSWRFPGRTPDNPKRISNGPARPPKNGGTWGRPPSSPLDSIRWPGQGNPGQPAGAETIPPWQIPIPGTGGIKPTREMVAAWEASQQKM